MAGKKSVKSNAPSAKKVITLSAKIIHINNEGSIVAFKADRDCSGFSIGDRLVATLTWHSNGKRITEAG